MTDTMNGRARAVATKPVLASGIRDRVARHLLQAAILVAFLLLWQYASGRWVAPLFISSPVAVWDTVVRWIADGTLLHHAVATFRVAVAGFLIGGLSAVVFGYLLGVSRFWAGVAEPFITALYALPKVAIIPLLIIWVGVGAGLSLVVCALIVFLLLFYNTFYGIREVKPALIDGVRIMGGGWADVAFKVRLPSAFVWIVAGMRISVPQALVGVVTAEILAGNRGLGYLVSFNAGQFNTAGTLAAVATLLLIGLGLDRVVALATRSALAWQHGGGR
ncbi:MULTISPECIES: ABC transporter permease [Pseudonocardia]|uniref:ABC transporter permease n=1 Tax=Pseudonocardia abyssalis TaxID=2792008 RepID=A0ABS6V1I3_9PSEU|nr:ABC transporter permease [Pseudonocardia abyssalis]MBW0113703.1 ABC transporter permease [Pseudonocardia abyssalis]MBW0138384.1 ABC transporter permease [Pseudonocardia abyssalis]